MFGRRVLMPPLPASPPGEVPGDANGLQELELAHRDARVAVLRYRAQLRTRWFKVQLCRPVFHSNPQRYVAEDRHVLGHGVPVAQKHLASAVVDEVDDEVVAEDTGIALVATLDPGKHEITLSYRAGKETRAGQSIVIAVRERNEAQARYHRRISRLKPWRSDPNGRVALRELMRGQDRPGDG